VKLLTYLSPISPPGLSIPHSIRKVAPLLVAKVRLLNPGHVNIAGVLGAIVEELVMFIVGVAI